MSPAIEPTCRGAYRLAPEGAEDGHKVRCPFCAKVVVVVAIGEDPVTFVPHHTTPRGGVA